MAQSKDKVIALHIPLDLYQFAYEQLVFSTGVTVTQEQKDAFHSKREKFIEQIDNKVNELNKDLNSDESNKCDFEFVISDDSVAIKYDLVDAADEFSCDYLVLGSKGHSHSVKEAVKPIYIYLYAILACLIAYILFCCALLCLLLICIFSTLIFDNIDK